MSDEPAPPRTKSMPPPVPQRRSVPPPEPTVRDAMPEGEGRPTSVRQIRSTTRMTTDEINAVIASNRAAAAQQAAGGAPPEGFDPERTMVLDPDEDGVDEAPTVDYDPRAKLRSAPALQTRSSRPASAAGPTPIIPPAPRVPALTQPSTAVAESAKDGGKKRSSRRTVKIPDDPVERRNLPQMITRADTQQPASPPQAAAAPPEAAPPQAAPPQAAPPQAAPPQAAGTAAEATRRAGSTTQPMDPPPDASRADASAFEAPDTYADFAKTAAHPAASLPMAPMQMNDTTDIIEPRAPHHGSSGADDGILRPMRIISVGSEPPPPITSAVAEWPSASTVGVYVPYGQSPMATPQSTPAPESDAAETVRKFVPPLTKTDLLPPAIPEDGWTPQAPAVLPRAAAVPQFGAPHGQQAQQAPQAQAPQAKPTTQPAPPAEAPNVQVELEESAQELLEDIEPDAAPVPKKPPPPPTKAQRERTNKEHPPETVETSGKKTKPWYEDLFSEDYIKTMDVLPEDEIRREVDFIEESLGVEKSGVILDLACGRGEHAIELAARGYNVVGLDLSPVALAMAHENLKDRASAHLGGAVPEMEAKPSFMRTDMRELNFEENFDGAYCWSTSFGYFEDEVNLAVLRRLHRALRQGGNLLIDVANRDYIAPRSPSLVWFEGDRCTCMDEMQVDFLTSRLKVKRTAMFEDGHSRELEYSLRLYSLDALGRMLREVGFRVVEVTGLLAHPGIFFGSESPRLIILAERT